MNDTIVKYNFNGLALIRTHFLGDLLISAYVVKEFLRLGPTLFLEYTYEDALETRASGKRRPRQKVSKKKRKDSKIYEKIMQIR